MVKKKNIFFLLFLLLLFVPSVWVLFLPGFIQTDDGNWMIIRFSAFYQSLRDGQFPVRLLGRLNFEYGYPVSNFLYPGFMYLATPLKVIGFSFIYTIKAVILLSMIGSGIGTYFWLRKHFSKVAGVIGALVYVYFPYHLFDVYKRGSVGEVLALCIIPLFLWCIDAKRFSLAGVAYAFLILSHNTLAFIFTPFLIMYVLSVYNYRKLSVFVLGLFLSAFFWVPAIIETRYTVFSTVAVSSWREYFIQIKNFNLIGLIGIIIAGGAVYGLSIKRNQLLRFFSLLYFLSIFLTLPISSFIWSVGLLPKIVQFPWRFLSVSLWAGAFIMAFVVDGLPKKKRTVFIAGIIFVIVVSAYPFLTNIPIDKKDEGFYATNEDTTTVKNEYMPVWVKVLPQQRPTTVVEVKNGFGTATVYTQKSNEVSYQVDAQSPLVTHINKIYYPGWEVRINGEKSVVRYNNQSGVMEVAVPKGTSTVTATFQETPFRFLMNVISLTCLVGLFVWNFYRFRYV